jgi:hypothetical protein
VSAISGFGVNVAVGGGIGDAVGVPVAGGRLVGVAVSEDLGADVSVGNGTGVTATEAIVGDTSDGVGVGSIVAVAVRMVARVGGGISACVSVGVIPPSAPATPLPSFSTGGTSAVRVWFSIVATFPSLPLQSKYTITASKTIMAAPIPRTIPMPAI